MKTCRITLGELANKRLANRYQEVLNLTWHRATFFQQLILYLMGLQQSNSGSNNHSKICHIRQLMAHLYLSFSTKHKRNNNSNSNISALKMVVLKCRPNIITIEIIWVWHQPCKRPHTLLTELKEACYRIRKMIWSHWIQCNKCLTCIDRASWAQHQRLSSLFPWMQGLRRFSLRICKRGNKWKMMQQPSTIIFARIPMKGR